jgi:integrase
MIRVRLKYLVHDPDRFGNDRYYVARRGIPKIRIWEPFGTQEFFAAYKRALENLGKPIKNKLEKVPNGSFEWLCKRYLSSGEFETGLAASTKVTKRRELNRLCKRIGHLPANKIEPQHIHRWMDECSGTPAAANQLLKTLKALFRFGVKRGLLSKNPTEKIGKLAYRAQSHHTWTREEVVQFCTSHPEGSEARLAVTLFLFTGLRLCDVASLTTAQILEDESRISTQKTGAEVRLNIHPTLGAELLRHQLNGGTVLRTAYGKPFSKNGLGNKMKQWCREAGLPHCSSHGLRSAGATIAAENGATVPELMAMYGWTNPSMAMKYIAAADKKLLSKRASEKIVIDLGQVKPITLTTQNQWEQNFELGSEINASRGRMALPAGIEPAFAT